MAEFSPSVLIIRLDGIGDALALTPMLAALRERSVPVDLVLREANAGVFAAAAARRFVTSGIRLRASDAANRDAIERLGRTLRDSGYTHVLVATEDPAGYRLAKAVDAPVRIGFTNGWGKPLKSLWSRPLLTHAIYRSAGLDRRGEHECAVLFRLAAPLLAGELPTRDVRALRPLLLAGEPAQDERIAVQVTTKWERLGIPFADVVELVDRIASVGTPHLLSDRVEASYAERVARSAKTSVSYFDDTGAWKNAIAAARALVAPDSGAMHVAGMVGTRVVGVFPKSRSYALQVARWAPWAAPHRTVCADANWPALAADALEDLLAR